MILAGHGKCFSQQPIVSCNPPVVVTSPGFLNKALELRLHTFSSAAANHDHSPAIIPRPHSANAKSKAYLFWRVFGFRIVLVLVLSEAVLVIVIDLSVVICAGLGDVSCDRLGSTKPLIASMSMKPRE
jgi:hypothetical protein